MGLAIILFAGAVVLLLWLFLWSRQRLEASPAEAIPDLPLVAGSDGLIVASEQGQVVHANDAARALLQVERVDLEGIARAVEPGDTFLDLFAHEAQASFQLKTSKRWIEATSRHLGSNGTGRMAVVLREHTRSASSPDSLDFSQVMRIVNEIGESLNASLGIEPVLQTLLMVIRKELPTADAGEINLWDEKTRTMNPRGWTGDVAYVLALAEAGGAYADGEGISGWIAQYRKPVFVADAADATTVRPKLKNAQYRSYLGMPLLVGDKLLGSLEFAAGKSFTQTDMALLQAIAPQVTTTVYNAQLYTNQARRIEDLATVQQVIDQKALESDPMSVFLALNERIAQLLDADICGVLVYDELRQALVAQPPYYGLPVQVVRPFAIPVTEGSTGYDIWQRQPYWQSSDLADEPLADELGLSMLVNAAGLRDTLLMPLQIGSQRIGMIQVSNKRSVGGFTPQDVQNLRLLSAQAAVAVEDMRLAQRQQIHESEMAGLQEISQTFGAISYAGDFYADINERIARVMGIAMCGILLYDEANGRLVAQKPFYGLDDSLIEHYAIHLTPESAMAEIWRDDDFWYTNNAATDKVVYGAGLAELVALVGVQKTLLGVMASGGRRLGVVQISNKLDGSDFTDNDARLLLIFAAQVGGMIENARLLREVQDRADESEGLRSVAEYAGTIMTGEDDLLPTLREICRLTNSPAAFVCMIDPQSGSLIGYPEYSYGFRRAEPLTYDAYSPGYGQSIAITRRAFLSNDLRNDERLPDYLHASREAGIVSLVVVPLIVGEQSLGELAVFNRSEPPYGADDIRNLQAVSIHVAAALDRVRLQEATGQNLRRRLQELDAISRVSNELATRLDFDYILDVIRQEAAQATDAEDSTIALLTPVATREATRADRRIGKRQTLLLTDIERQATRQGSEPVLVEDYSLQSAYRAIPDTVRSAIAAAFIYEDQAIGLIHLTHSQPFHFDERAAVFLETLAAKASLAYGNNLRYLENQERSDKLRRRVEQLNQIFELGQMLQTNVDTGSILEAIAFSVQQSIRFDIVMMLLVDDDAGVLRRTAQAGLPIDAFEASKRNTLPITTLQKLFENEQFRVSESYFLPFQQISQWYVDGLEAISTGQAVTRTMHPSSRDDWYDGDMLIVPLSGAGGNLLGVMSLDRPFDGRRPDRNTVEILEIFAHQAVATLENTRLYMSTVRSAEQEARLNEVMEAIASTLDMNEIVESVANGVLRLLPFMRMAVALLESEQQGFDVVSVTVKPDSTLVVQREHSAYLERSALGHTFETGEDFLYGEDSEADFDDLATWRAQGERTSLVVPMITGGLCLGAMHLGSDLSEAFGFEEFRPLVKRIANLTAVALQNARLFEGTRARTERLSLLNRVSVALAQSLDTENITEIALREIAQILRSDRARAAMFERETNTARIVVEYPRGDNPPNESFDLSSNAVYGVVMRSAKPLVVEDVTQFKGDESLRAQIQRGGFASYVVLPLTVGGQVSGVLELEVHKAPRKFEPERIELSTIIANQAAIAVLNANLLEQTLVRTRELETLLEAAQATSYTLDLDEVFSSVIRLALQALDLDEGAIMIYDNVEEALNVQLQLNRDGDRNNLIRPGTAYDLHDYPAKSRAVRDGQILVLRADDPDARERAEMAENDEKVRILVPLIVRDQAIGLLQMALQGQARAFTHREVRMAQALGAQAATAIENARLSTQTAALVEQSLVINDISRTISSTMNTADMIGIVREHIPSLTDAEEILLALYDVPTEMISFPLALRRGQDVVIAPRKLGNDEFSFVIRYHRPAVMGGDNPSAAELRRNLKIVTDVESTRFLGVPLMAGEQIAGVLAVRDTQQSRPFGLNEHRILTTIAAQLGATLQNAQLFERVRNFAEELNARVEERTRELQEERDRLDTLYQITAELGRTLDIDRVLARALEMVARAVGADDGAVLLLDPQTERLYIRALMGGHDKDEHPAEILANWMITHENAVLVDDLALTDYWSSPDPRWHSAISVVLATNEDIQGVIVLLGRGIAQFTEPHLKLVIAAANQVSSAVNNADLYNLIREQNDRMAVLLRTEQEEAEKNSAILEGIADGVLLADASGVVVLFNSAAEQILGLPRDYALGQPLSRIAGSYGGTAQWVSALDAWVRTPRRDEQAELLIDRLEVGSRVVSVHASPVYNGDEFLGTVSVFRDVTRDVEVDRMKSEFISNVSHELRTPMTSIKGYADLLISGAAGSTTDVQKGFLGTIKGNADRLADLVNDLLNISRIDSGRDRLKLEDVQVGDVLKQAVTSLQERPQFASKHLTITTEIEPDVPMVKADLLKLVQIVTNLVDNAFNYTYPGGTIDVSARRRAEQPGHVLITVRDSGIGIPEEFRERIWNRFERYEEHALVMEVAGTGLGLSIVRTLVEMHDGEIWFESEENKGTTFYVSLPIAGPERVKLTSEQTVEG